MQYHTRLTIINMFTNITCVNIMLQTWTQPTEEVIRIVKTPRNVPTSRMNWSSVCAAISWMSGFDDARFEATADTVRLTTFVMCGPTHGRMSQRTPSAISVTLPLTSRRHGTKWSKICTGSTVGEWVDSSRHISTIERLTLWRPVLPCGYSCKASCARLG